MSRYICRSRSPQNPGAFRVAAVTHYTRPVAPVALQLPGVSHVELPLKRCRATRGCSSYTYGCRATLRNHAGWCLFHLREITESRQKRGGWGQETYHRWGGPKTFLGRGFTVRCNPPVLSVLPFLVFLEKRQRKPPKKQGFLSLPNPQNPWKRREKRSKKQGNPCRGEKQGTPKKQGRTGPPPAFHPPLPLPERSCFRCCFSATT